ncbi:hypothetical protein CkaCkLH20_05960 [Colletotrichum karsti]|uniref:Uncharacterized protein n=1 Tax=Colletotrichum karsti TaxID=1095194 RepID=A0A9P6I419_9PEZI|nr:uncharacterized protein CkaCkLH20_05960 [Colletotrichum karsti]KAF9876552.1 hypothetical protein CkaCkLH20_05960 [Colletotrichum karsti]
MPEIDALRLYVYLHFSNNTTTVEVEFPSTEKDLAEAYRQSIRRHKDLELSRDDGNIVAFELPPSATDVSTTRSARAIIVHFKRSNDAKRWADAICRPVADSSHQVYVKQYWNEADLAGLRESLNTSSSSSPPKPSLLKPSSDRGGAPPRPALTSVNFIGRLGALE